MRSVLLLHGAGAGAYEADKKLADSLRHALGSSYEVQYPALPNEEDAPYEEWAQRIEHALTEAQGPIALVGHSVGASVLIKYLSENEVQRPIAGIFLVANPFWGGAGWRYDGWEQLALPDDAASRLPENAPIFLYHCRDDETVPFDHLSLYAKALPQAIVRAVEAGGHQFDDDLSIVAADIKSLP